MGRAVLVAGLLPHDSGKTTLSLMLARALREEGVKVKAMKPVAAHSAWFQPWSMAESFRMGVLVGGDVVRYVREGLISNPDVQNPIDILTAPPDPLSYPSASSYVASTETLERQVIAARVSIHGRAYYIVPSNLSRLPPTIQSALKPILSIMNPAAKVSPEWLLLRLTSPEISAYVSAMAESLKRSTDVLIVESFNNALVPVSGIEGVIDTLVLVAPGRALIYRGSKLRAYLSGIPRGFKESTASFASIARPDEVVSVPLTGPGAGGGKLRLSSNAVKIILGDI